MTPETRIVLAVASAAAAGAAYALLRQAGGREWGGWALPVSAAVLFGGIGFALDLPDWAVIGGVVLGPALAHAAFRSRMEDAARRIDLLEIPKSGLRLRRIPDYSGKYAAIWNAAYGPEASCPPGTADPLVIALSFIRSGDEYEVDLHAEPAKPLSGKLLAHHRAAGGEFTSLVKTDPIESMLGLPDWVCLRSDPADFAFQVMDAKTAALIVEVLNFRGPGREIFLHAEGPRVRVGASAVFTESELRALLPSAALLFARLRLEV
jgi:hypothetical protein